MLDSTMNALVDAGSYLDIEVTAREKYSGRFMYGKETCAIVLDRIEQLLPLVALVGNRINDEEELELLITDLSIIRTDHLGLGIIVY